MAIRVRAMLRKWFGRGMYPTAEQFSDLFDSFWHKTEDEISMDKVGGLTDQLNGKYPDADGKRLEERIAKDEENLADYIEQTDEAIDQLREEDAAKFTAHGIDRVYVRSVLGCKARSGVCARCYGMNLATSELVNLGEAVGIIAAQSIGEPGTQLTMRTFHTGGVATAEDITQGLPRVEELFEARKPKGNAIISNIAGKVTIEDSPENANIKIVTVTNEETSDTYKIPFGKRISVNEGDEIEAGTRLIEGNINPHDILRVLGVQATQNYIVKEVQKVYRSQGVEINDKHIEIIVHQMLRKIKIDDPGDSEWLPGQTVDIVAYRVMNEHLEDEGKKPAVGENLLLGTTKAALATDSFLSAASFQETTRVLTEAAIKGKVDPLLGLKENVIIGKLIPAGTGLARYRRLSVQHNAEPRTAETADGQADVQ